MSLDQFADFVADVRLRGGHPPALPERGSDRGAGDGPRLEAPGRPFARRRTAPGSYPPRPTPAAVPRRRPTPNAARRARRGPASPPDWTCQRPKSATPAACRGRWPWRSTRRGRWSRWEERAGRTP